jgi:hypothetical protein
MDPNPRRMNDRHGRILCVLLIVLFGLVVLEPLRLRAKAPSIYADDVVRIAQVRTMPLREMVVRPFNEHLAPCFEVVTWTAWKSCGGRLTRAPLAFTLASLLPFALCEVALLLLVRRETGSWTASLVGVAIFGLSWLPIETAWWYSASSFAWSLLGVLAAWIAILRPGGVGVILSILACLAAPAFSMIGILAGPIAAVRCGIAGLQRRAGPRAMARAFTPLIGTAGFLVFASLFGHRRILAGSVQRNFRLMEAVGPILRAPITVLMPAVAGVKNLDGAIPHLASYAVCGALATVLAVLVFRRRLDAGLVLGGLSLVVCGYALTYGARAGTENLMNVQRYHLFPQAGLALIAAAVVARLAGRVDRRPAVALGVGVLVALVLLGTHRAEFKGRARFLRFTGQDATLAAMEHVESLCERRRISRDDALRALDPIRNRWFDFDLNALTMIAPNPPNPATEPAGTIRATIVRAISQKEREALWGGMDVTARMNREPEVGACVVLPRLENAYRLRQPPRPGETAALPDGLSYLEFSSDLDRRPSDRPSTLHLDGLPTSGTVEIWWNGRAGRWSEGRSVRLDPSGSGGVSIPLASLPHWDPTAVDRLRVRFRGPGRVGMVTPKFFR